jgi:predicted oxidoreductase
MQRVDSRLDNISGSVEIGLTNLEVDNFFSLLLQRPGAVQNFKSSFRAKPRHPAGKT